MKHLPLNAADASQNPPPEFCPHILIFTEGTVLGPGHWWEFYRVNHYVAIGRCVEKVTVWAGQGARQSKASRARWVWMK